jgi:hypothetical protein
VSRILHLARADMRRWRWALVAALTLIVLQRVVSETAPVVALERPQLATLVDSSCWCGRDAASLQSSRSSCCSPRFLCRSRFRCPIFPTVTVTPPSWTNETDRLRLSIDPLEAFIGVASDEGYTRGLTRQRFPHALRTNLLATGVPRDVFAEIVDLSARVSPPTGAPIEDRGLVVGEGLPSAPREQIRMRHAAWSSAVGIDLDPIVPGGPAAPRDPAQMRWRTPLVRVKSGSDADRLAAAPSEMDLVVTFDLWKHSIVGELPVAPGRLLRGSTLLEIKGVRRDSRAIQVLVRRSRIAPALRPEAQSYYFVAFKHPQRAEALSGGHGWRHGTFEDGLRLASIMGNFFFTTEATEGPEWMLLEVNTFRAGGLGVDSLDRATLLIVEQRFEGRVTRRLHVDRIPVQDHSWATPPKGPFVGGPVVGAMH